jgi:hypothetical protein
LPRDKDRGGSDYDEPCDEREGRRRRAILTLQTRSLAREDWAARLDLTKTEAALLRSLPAGALRVEQAR